MTADDMRRRLACMDTPSELHQTLVNPIIAYLSTRESSRDVTGHDVMAALVGRIDKSERSVKRPRDDTTADLASTGQRSAPAGTPSALESLAFVAAHSAAGPSEPVPMVSGTTSVGELPHWASPLRARPPATSSAGVFAAAAAAASASSPSAWSIAPPWMAAAGSSIAPTSSMALAMPQPVPISVSQASTLGLTPYTIGVPHAVPATAPPTSAARPAVDSASLARIANAVAPFGATTSYMGGMPVPPLPLTSSSSLSSSAGWPGSTAHHHQAASAWSAAAHYSATADPVHMRSGSAGSIMPGLSVPPTWPGHSLGQPLTPRPSAVPYGAGSSLILGTPQATTTTNPNTPGMLFPGIGGGGGGGVPRFASGASGVSLPPGGSSLGALLPSLPPGGPTAGASSARLDVSDRLSVGSAELLESLVGPAGDVSFFEPRIFVDRPSSVLSLGSQLL